LILSPIGEHVKRFSIDGCKASLFQRAENLDALLQILSVGGHMGADLSLESLLPLRVPGMEIVPHMLINLPVQLVLICLAHPTADFAEFPREIIDGALVKLCFIAMAGFEGLDYPREGLIIDVNGFDECGQFVGQVFFTYERFSALALEARTPVIDIATSLFLTCCSGIRAQPQWPQVTSPA